MPRPASSRVSEDVKGEKLRQKVKRLKARIKKDLTGSTGKIQDTGMLVQKWPVVLDMDVAGEVFEVGAGIVEFSKGDRVVA